MSSTRCPSELDRLRLIARIAARMHEEPSLEGLLQGTADAIHDMLGFPNVDIPMLDPDEPFTLVVSVRGGNYKAATTILFGPERHREDTGDGTHRTVQREFPNEDRSCLGMVGNLPRRGKKANSNGQIVDRTHLANVGGGEVDGQTQRGEITAAIQ